MQTLHTRLLPLPLLALALLPLGCSDDPSGPDTDLSSVEIQTTAITIFVQSVPQVINSTLFEGPEASGPQQAPVAIDEEVIEDIDCSISGFVETLNRINGTVDDETPAADLAFEIERDHKSCVEGAEGSSVQVEITGAPGITGSYDLVRTDEGEITVEGTLSGTVMVSTATTEETCGLFLGFTGTGAETGIDYIFVGTLCNLDFQATLSTSL